MLLSDAIARRIALFICAFSMFAVEMSALRLVSVVTWPPFAFLALSAAMLGGGAGATLLAIRPSWSLKENTPFLGALLLSVGAPIAALAVHFSHLEPLVVGQQLIPTLKFSAVLLLLALPFIGLSLCLTALLEQFPDEAFSLYGADLCGAATGALLTGMLLQIFGTSATFAAAGAFSALGALFLKNNTQIKRAPALTGALAALIFSLSIAAILSSNIPSFTAEKRIAKQSISSVLHQLQKSNRHFFIDGNDGRVDVIPGSPRSVLLIDGGAALARAPRFSDATLPPTQDPTSVAFAAKPFQTSSKNQRVLVIGSAAGFEVHRALRYGAPHIDAVEVSEAVWQAATSTALPTAKATFANARVNNVHDEARSFLEHTQQKYSHIIAIHTISNAALSSSAMRLAEDFLLTTEGMSAMVSHLQDKGVLYMTRPASQIDLLALLAKHALLQQGIAPVDVKKHILLISPQKDDPFFRGLLVSRAPLKAPLSQEFLNAAHLNAEPIHFKKQVELPTDQTPFFHRFSDSVGDKARMRLQIEGPDLAERSVLWVGGLATLLALCALFLPLLLGRKKSESPALLHLGIALGIGIGFLLLEVNLVQRLSLFLGHPQNAYAIVLGGLLLGAGLLGLFRAKKTLSLTSALFFASLGCAFGYALPQILDVTGVLSLPFYARALLCFLGAAFTGAPLGLVFPALIQSASSPIGQNAAWLFALNACASVAGSALNATLGPRFGLDGAAVIAFALYFSLFTLTLLHARKKR